MERRQKWNISSVQVTFCLVYVSKENFKRLRSEFLFFIINTMIFFLNPQQLQDAKLFSHLLNFPPVTSHRFVIHGW